MSLKAIIERHKALPEDERETTIELIGQPSLFSMNERKIDGGLSSKIKSKFEEVVKNWGRFRPKNVPMVVLATFYVQAPRGIEIDRALITPEKEPARQSFELVDHYLWLQDLLKLNAISRNTDVVKIEVQKIYSHRPRTHLKLLTWEEYLALQRKSTDETSTETSNRNRKKQHLQS